MIMLPFCSSECGEGCQAMIEKMRGPLREQLEAELRAQIEHEAQLPFSHIHSRSQASIFPLLLRPGSL